MDETPPCNSSAKDHIVRNALSETRMKLRNSTPLQYFDDEDAAGDTHNVGPIEKYLVLEKELADRIHIFSSFFYKCLNQREGRNLQDTANLTLQQRRHGRVKNWTGHVDLFQKDFIFVPLNEELYAYCFHNFPTDCGICDFHCSTVSSTPLYLPGKSWHRICLCLFLSKHSAHWFLAVICFPGLEEPVFHPNPYYQAGTLQASSLVDDSRTSATPGDSQTCLQGSGVKSNVKKTPNKKQNLAPSDTSTGTDDSDTPGTKSRHSVGRHALRRNDPGQEETNTTLKSLFPQTDLNPKNVNGITEECKMPLKPLDGLHRIQISYSESPDDSKKNEEEFIDSSDNQDNPDESSDDGGLADENFTSEAGKWHLKSTFCKQPCILLMDSLRGPSRSTVVKTLREYLEVEWEVKKGTKRNFSKEVMKGSNPRVPQQNNFSDCGVYVLQYVESFFESPIQSFDLPMNLINWFPQQRMKTKREEIRNLILNLQELQSKDKKGQRDLNTAQPAPSEGTEQIQN